MGNRLDLSNQRFGKLIVEGRAGKDSSGHSTWNCKCDCGGVTVARGSHLKYGYIQSCGCLVAETLAKQSRTHGLEHTRLYRIWKGMLVRCYNPKSNRYHRYGGRGITVCEDWKNSVTAFYKWAIKNGYRDDLTIERKDNDGPYSPDNCIWVTMKVQLNHTSRSRNVTLNGVTKTLSQWAEETGIKTNVIYGRLNRGWPIERAVTEPLRKGKKVTANG